jgi:hypothetical protein
MDAPVHNFRIVSIYSLGRIRSSEAATGWGGARSALFGMLMSPKKTGARSARARTLGQNPLVLLINDVTAGIIWPFRYV